MSPIWTQHRAFQIPFSAMVLFFAWVSGQLGITIQKSLRVVTWCLLSYDKLIVSRLGERKGIQHKNFTTCTVVVSLEIPGGNLLKSFQKVQKFSTSTLFGLKYYTHYPHILSFVWNRYESMWICMQSLHNASNRDTSHSSNNNDSPFNPFCNIN